MKVKKFLSVLLAVLLVVSMLPMGIISIGATENTGMTGRGTQHAPYVIWDACGWAEFVIRSYEQNFSGKFIELGCDIDLSELDADLFEQVYDKIGSSYNFVDGVTNPKYWTVGASKAFEGCFDGNGYTISNFYLSSTGSIAAGAALFGYIGSNAYVGNFEFTDSWIETTAGINKGVIAALHGTNIVIENITVSNCVVWTESTGTIGPCGFIGSVYGGYCLIKDITVKDSVFVNSPGYIGLIARLTSSSSMTPGVPSVTVVNADIDNTIFAYNFFDNKMRELSMGGIVGGTNSSSAGCSLSISDCDVNATFIQTRGAYFTASNSSYMDTAVGGIVGSGIHADKIEISNCNADIEVDYGYNSIDSSVGNILGIGGIIGIDSLLETTIENCNANIYVELVINQSSDTVVYDSGAMIGGIVAIDWTSDITNCKSEVYIVDAIMDSASEMFYLNSNYDYINLNGQSIGTANPVKAYSYTYSTLIEAGMGTGINTDDRFVIDSVEDWALLVHVAKRNTFSGKQIFFEENVELANLDETYKEMFGTDMELFDPEYTDIQPSFDGNIAIDISPVLSDSFDTIAEIFGYDWGLSANGEIVTPDENGNFSIGFSAKDINENIEIDLVIFYDETGDNYFAFDNYFDINMREYAEQIAANGTEEQKAAVSATLAYTDAASNYFGGTDVEASEADYSSVFDVTASGGSSNVIFMGTTLMLESKTSIRFYFKLAEGVLPEDINVWNGTLVQKGDSDWYYVQISGISAEEYGEYHTVIVDGVVVTGSVLSYCKAAQRSGDINLAYLTNAMLNYNKEILAYIDSKAR